MGGMLALNSTGSKWCQYGTPREKVLELEVVFANGEIATLTRSGALEDGGFNTEHFEAKVLSIINRDRHLIRESRPNTKINQAGYNIFDLESDDRVDLAKLIVGSEGTLGVITKAKLQTEQQPHHRGVACFLSTSTKRRPRRR